jgi:hypothetical protein
MYFGSAGAQGGAGYRGISLGNGGNGGGILAFYANNLTVSGSIQSNGTNGISDSTGVGAGGGGGAGGSLYIAADTQNPTTNLITVVGGAGGIGAGYNPAGGAGGAGRLVNIITPNPTATVTVTPSVTPSPIATESGACTLINVYKKADGVWGTAPLTTAELQQLKTGDVLKFSLVSATDLTE